MNFENTYEIIEFLFPNFVEIARIQKKTKYPILQAKYLH